MKQLVLIVGLFLVPSFVVGDHHDRTEYRPGGDEFAGVWEQFYSGDHEPELDDPLIAAGGKMTLVICDAIGHRDMRLRRYAIGALGHIGDERSLPALESILRATDEIHYFRGDALHAIYLINRAIGKQYALEFADDHSYLRTIADAIAKDEKWLADPSTE